jgi:glycosyltransferase involved in cell wall biosynthesis
MRVLIIAGVVGKAEAGGAGVVHNVAKELRSLGHTVKPMFFEDLIPELPPDRVWFIANGVGQEFFHRRAWPETREPKLLFVGTWIDHKGLYALAETLEQLLVLAARVQLTMAGCAETEERARRYFSPTAQRSINVRPFISRAEMPEVYAQQDIFVLPALVEGMPSVFLLEAMASGLAVVTTESTGMTDLVEDGHDGVLTIAGDADSLTVAISTLCGNSQPRYKLGCAAQEKMKRFTWKLSALRHEAVFRRAMGVKPLPTVPEPHETNIDGAPYSGKVVLN